MYRPRKSFAASRRQNRRALSAHDRLAERGGNRREFIEKQRNPAAVNWDPKRRLEETGEIRRMRSSSDIVDYFLREFLQREPSRDVRDAVLELAGTDGSGGRHSMSVEDTNFDERARGLVHLIMSSPDYQLC